MHRCSANIAQICIIQKLVRSKQSQKHAILCRIFKDVDIFEKN